VQAVDYYWVGSEARIAGTVVHRWLQFAAQKGGVDALADDRLAQATDRWLRELGVAAGETMTRIRDRIDAALRGVRDDPRGRWLLSGDGHAELALSGVVDGAVESGVLDRIRIDDDGTHWIVDYKTSTHEGGNLEGFLAAEADRYRDQLERYAVLYRAWKNADVRCALYFPLLQAFIEVESRA
jgi:ATP-dependent exoDNAse (exonuclease V) beta subunit